MKLMTDEEYALYTDSCTSVAAFVDQMMREDDAERTSQILVKMQEIIDLVSLPEWWRADLSEIINEGLVGLKAAEVQP